jgi:hypothetical protein
MPEVGGEARVRFSCAERLRISETCAVKLQKEGVFLNTLWSVYRGRKSGALGGWLMHPLPYVPLPGNQAGMLRLTVGMPGGRLVHTPFTGRARSPSCWSTRGTAHSWLCQRCRMQEPPPFVRDGARHSA